MGRLSLANFSKLHSRLLSIVFLTLLLGLASCDSEKERRVFKQPDKSPSTAPTIQAPSDPVWAEYISRHTSGVVSKASEIKINFVRDVIPEEKIGQDASSVIEITPAVQADITFNGRREIVASPSEYLTPGTEYQVKVLNNQLQGVPEALGNYDFSFAVTPKDFEVRIQGLSSTAKTATLTAKVMTSDREESEQVEKMVRVEISGQELQVNWFHSSDGTLHEFTVHDIQRGLVPAALNILWDGSSIDADREGEHLIKVPPLGEFKLAQVRAVEAGARKYIQLRFSESLDSSQNLKGLIQLGKADFSLRVEGDRLNIYPSNTAPGAYTVTIEKGILAQTGAVLSQRLQKDVYFEMQDPQVHFSGTGVILPDNPVLSVPFEAINAKSVQVTAFRVYDDNIGQFLQSNKLQGGSSLGRVGRFLWRKKIELGQVEDNNWNRFSLDATELLASEPGALFRLTISINRGDSNIVCTQTDIDTPVVKEQPFRNHDDVNLAQSSGWDFAEDYYNENVWRDRRNPCKDAYYKHSSNTKASRNFISSNIGVIAKRGSEGSLKIVTTNLKTAKPLSGVKIDVRNFQDQSIGKMTTDVAGFAELKSQTTPFYLIAKSGNQFGYLKVNAATALPVSHFDVGGEKVAQGVKGHIYGERGVWRPGDNIYLTFVLEDKNNIIPDEHPVTMQLFDPKGQMTQTKTNNTPVDGFYTFKMKTADNAITGNWTARAMLGGTIFTRQLKIETVIPNRLRVETSFEDEDLRQSRMPVKGHLFAQWLHGADAKKLKADVSVRLVPKKTRFTRNADFIFDDPARRFKSEPQTIFEGQLDETGNTDFDTRITAAEGAGGMLTAHFTSRVFEEGGAFSTSQSSTAYHPYDNYVGIKLPKGDATRNMLLTDNKHPVEIASLSADGEPVSLPAVEVSIYKISWRWWWDQSGDDLASYVRSSHRGFIQRDVISTKDGVGKWEFDIKYPDWGRYLVRACDLNGKHCAGKIVYIDWPGWAGRASESGGVGANALTLQSDKQTYQVGEVATISLPPATQGRALISVETGSKIIEQHWFEFSEQKSQFPMTLTNQMSPNVYVSVTLIQPHAGKDNDRPIRMYGVVPIKVEDPATRLKPELKAAEEWAPATTAQVEVSESQGLQMTYTLAVVDEGLLGLTSFKTPDLHKHFYKKEALGVLTWDLFDQVTGAYGGELERLLSLGGDEDAEEEASSEEKKRFPPVVRFMGPFTLKAGETRKHSIDIPQYIGAVRVMIVAGSDEKSAYGSADQSVFVRGSLSLLATVPRVIGPDEELSVPVALFTMRDEIKEVELSADVSDHFEVVGEAKQTIHFDAPGEKLGKLKFKVKSMLGKGRLKFIATSGDNRAESEIYIDVRSANPSTLRQVTKELDGGDDWKHEIVPHGIPGTNKITMEVSSVPPINLERRLNYLIRYPHGCVEQVTSSVFPQLYLPTLVSLGSDRKEEVQGNIDAGIERLRRFQVASGAFSYWPGGWNSHINEWASNYVGHFLLEAKKQGYHVPSDMLDNWISYQTEQAQNWVTGTGESQANQAYRLYTLALANQPALASMNRLREGGNLTTIVKWQLASAYRLAGLNSAADELAGSANLKVGSYRFAGINFGSSLRDRAILLDGLVTLGKNKKARKIVEDISDDLYADKWHSTQSIAYSLMALAKYVGVDQPGEPATFTWELARAGSSEVQMTSPLYQLDLNDFPQEQPQQHSQEGQGPQKGQAFRLENTSKRVLYASIFSEGVPKAGDEEAESEGLRLKVVYEDKDGSSLRVSELTQGQDFVAKLIIRNLNDHQLDNIALTHIVPSGWEIHNSRFAGAPEDSSDDKKKEGNPFNPYRQKDARYIDYQDIRDDRVLTYFGLKPNEEKEFKVQLNATYLGRYYQPGISVEAMYDASNQARTTGQWVQVIKENQ